MPRLPFPRPTGGLFISFEGGEGTGKSTQVERLRNRLRAAGRGCLATREPGGSPRAETIRARLLAGAAAPFGAEAEAMLFAAARADHLQRLIRPALARGDIVLCDRFSDSTRVYQGGALASGLLDALDRVVVDGTRPDATILLDLPVSVGLARARARRLARGEGVDRFEREDPAFHEGVRERFLALASAAPERCTIVDATASPEMVAEVVWRALAPLLAGSADVG